MRRFLWMIAALVLVPALSAQDNAQSSTPAQNTAPAQNQDQTNGGNTPAVRIFPLSLVLEGAKFAADCGAWRPDWPPELPPDAFKVNSGEISGIGLEGDGVSLCFSYDSDGRAAEFPFMLNGKMAQVSVDYGEHSEIREMALAFPPEKTDGGEGVPAAALPGAPPVTPPVTPAVTPPDAPPVTPPDTPADNSAAANWKLEFLEYNDSFPAVVRVSQGDAWYFIYLKRTLNEIMETWYDETGNFLGAYGFSLAEIGKNMRIRALTDYSDPDSGPEYYYDSRGFQTEISGAAGDYKVLYFRQDLPRYWERPGPAGTPPASAGTPPASAGTPPASAGTPPASAVTPPASAGTPPNSAGTGDDGAGNRTINYSFQWDETGILLRMSGNSENGDNLSDGRYEYDFDERGNWIARREVQMIHSLGLLIPAQGPVFKRVLEYRE